MHRYFLQSVIVLSAAILWSSCNKKDSTTTPPTDNTYKLSGNATGAQERPDPVVTDATATLSGSYNSENKKLDYTITWTGLSANASAAHFHGPADVNTAAGVEIAIPNVTAATSGTVSGTATLTADQETQLLTGMMYYNIHDSNHPGGEVRSQVTATHN
jgi:hypothetical protein